MKPIAFRVVDSICRRCVSREDPKGGDVRGEGTEAEAASEEAGEEAALGLAGRPTKIRPHRGADSFSDN